MSLTFCPFVECAGLVIVGALRTADAGDDGEQEESSAGNDHDAHHYGHTGQVLLLPQGVTTATGAAVPVPGGATAVHIAVGLAVGGAEESIVPDTKDVNIARAVLRSTQT